jgi:micrococcal nuclease
VQLLHLCVVVLAAFLVYWPAAAQPRSESVLVRYVVDGDTIDVVGAGRVRLLGIDAPELGRGVETSEPFAIEAHQRLSALVAQRWVRLESEDRSIRRDDYNRRLAYVLLETGILVNAVLVREGLARVSARRALRRLSELKRAEGEAQRSGRGIWGERPQTPLERYVVPRRQ